MIRACSTPQAWQKLASQASRNHRPIATAALLHFPPSHSILRLPERQFIEMAPMVKKSYADDMAKRLKDITLVHVGRHLRMLRTAFNQSQQQWADAMGISPQLLNKWEKGTRQPNIEKIMHICDSTRCTLDFIYRGRLGRDVDPELRQQLSSLFGDAFVLIDFPAEPPQPPHPSAGAAAAKRKQRTKSANPARHVSTRRSPPTPPGGPSKPRS